MNRFLVFAGIDYEALGGWRDFAAALPTPEEAKKCAELLFDIAEELDCGIYICQTHGKTMRTMRPNNYRADWAHLVDTKTGNVLFVGAPESWCSVCGIRPEWPVWEQMAEEA